MFLGIILAVALFAGSYWYQSTHPLSNWRFGFQYYKPTELPAGFHITDKRIDILSPDGKLFGIDAEMNLRTEDWVYSITESKVMEGDSDVYTSLNNYDPSSIGVTCRQGHSPKLQLYRLCHWVDYGRISVYEVKFIRGNTYINTDFPGKTSSVVPVSVIDRYVDSFVKGSATGFKILSGGP